MAKKKFKKQYKLKIIEHRTIDVEANSEEDAIAWAEGKINKYGVVRPITGSNFKTIKKVLKRKAKVISEQDSADVIEARIKRDGKPPEEWERSVTFGVNGTWKMPFSTPLYQWLLETLM